jgi:uncharacterized membrane protein (UPF0127 family)
MTRTQRIFLIGSGTIALIVVVALAYIANSTVPESALVPKYPLPTVLLDGQTISVSIADTEATRERGLGGRSGLADHEGMLFVFPQDGYYAFWMKDMEFSIDMVWLSAQGKVVFIEQNVAPSTYPNAFQPTSPARYVIELPAGFVQQYNIKIGDSAVLPKV